MEMKKRRNLIPDFFRASYFNSRSKSPSLKDKSSLGDSLHNQNNKKQTSSCSSNHCCANYTADNKSNSQVCQSVEDQSNMPSMSTFAPMMIPLSSFVSSSNTSHTVNNTSNAQVDAQTALLLAVLRATPNEVFYGLARDFLWNSYRSITTSLYNTIQDNITSHLSSVNRRFYRNRNTRSSQSSLTETKDSESEDSGFDSDWKKRRQFASSTTRVNSRATTTRRSKSLQQLQSKQGDYFVLKAFLKIIVKLYLTLILEVVTLALKFLG
jgi:ATP-dependent Lon protease